MFKSGLVDVKIMYLFGTRGAELGAEGECTDEDGAADDDDEGEATEDMEGGGARTTSRNSSPKLKWR